MEEAGTYTSTMGSAVDTYITDGLATVNTCGLLAFQKWHHQGEKDDVGLFALELTYKEGQVIVDYGPDCQSRDTMFEALVHVLATWTPEQCLTPEGASTGDGGDA